MYHSNIYVHLFLTGSSKMWTRAILDVSLLAERCLYFANYFDFYHAIHRCLFHLELQIPDHPLLSTEMCILFLTYLSLSDVECYAMFDKVQQIESIVFFSSFFQCHFLFKYIYKRGVNNLHQIPEILKAVSYTKCGNEMYMSKLLWFTADFTERVSVQSLLDDMYYDPVLPYPNNIYSSYDSSKIREEIEHKLALHQYDTDELSYMCAACGERHMATIIPYDVSVSRMSCCNAPVNCICYTNFLYRSYVHQTNFIRCKDCGIKWWLGKPACGKPMLKWIRKRYKKLRKRFIKDRYSFFCKQH